MNNDDELNPTFGGPALGRVRVEDLFPSSPPVPPPPRVRFQHRYTVHIVLFVLTFITTTYREFTLYPLGWVISGFQGPTPWRIFFEYGWPMFKEGIWFSIPLLTFLTAHEFGHYFACRIHKVDATLPFYIPAPLPLTGTFGAVIRIKEPFPSKRALFDIGVAGPIAGFVMLLPFLFWGMRLSHIGPIDHGPGALELGESALFRVVSLLHFGPLQAGQEVYAHPMGIAAWWGMLATALNLLPFGQLDGGHVVYSLLGRRSQYVSIATLAATLALTFWSLSWISVAVMMFIMAIVVGLRHPRIIDEEVPLDPFRRLVALFALVIFVLCFTPVPIQTFFS